MPMMGWMIFLVVGISVTISRLFIPPSENQSVKMRRFWIVAISLFILSIYIFILTYDHYQNLNVQLKQRAVDLYQRAILKGLSAPPPLE